MDIVSDYEKKTVVIGVTTVLNKTKNSKLSENNFEQAAFLKVVASVGALDDAISFKKTEDHTCCID